MPVDLSQSPRDFRAASPILPQVEGRQKPNPPRRRLIVAITGASGVMIGVRILELLRARQEIETHLIISPAGLRTLREETDLHPDALRALADHVHAHGNIGAAIASGSFRTEGMIVAPCTIATLSAIAQCHSDNLIARAADVCLKERRRLVLMVRETPFHAGHLDLMTRATRNGAIIMPPVPAFYLGAETMDEMITQMAARALDVMGIEVPELCRWTENCSLW